MQTIIFFTISMVIVSSDFNSSSDNSTDFSNFSDFSDMENKSEEIYFEENDGKFPIADQINDKTGIIKNTSTESTPESTTSSHGWTGLRTPRPDKKLRELQKELAKQRLKQKEIELRKVKAKEKEAKRRHRHEKKGNKLADKKARQELEDETFSAKFGSLKNRTIAKEHRSKRKHISRKSQHERPEKIIQHSKECIDCDPKEKAKRIETFRRQVLEKLRVEKVPSNYVSPPRLPPQYDPEYMQDEWLDDGDDSFYAKTKQLIIPASDVSHHCAPRHATGCYHFVLKRKITGYITSAKLWIFKNRDQNDKQQSFTISELEPDTRYDHTKLRPKNIVDRIETDVKKGWLQFNMTSSVRKWLEKPHMNHGFSVRCKTCYYRKHRVLFGAKEGYRPVLVIHLGRDRGRRGRRSIDCTPGETSCCRQQFYISFEDIENFVQVLEPKGIWANYCTGSCHEPTNAHYNHTSLIQAMRWRAGTVNETFMEEIKPCCSPISYLTKSMLIIEPSGDLSYNEIPNISVQACGCV
ncbi:hypothetical protein LOTGIDRAFT_151945 [Lottia gigantea]|uniref:TGF-beta family profile domain-containing protein n=1 Tax=Lottia gigantea TaxID=225164 RepID=V4ALT0_LOTGI|nr:hypothetical protein LOTGIDRAFT_151945 [Lottia gigantea]ESP05144.1 hypothetical protein LOTGIDRAFT_151945 [Lottia gigantea]